MKHGENVRKNAWFGVQNRRQAGSGRALRPRRIGSRGSHSSRARGACPRSAQEAYSIAFSSMSCSRKAFHTSFERLLKGNASVIQC